MRVAGVGMRVGCAGCSVVVGGGAGICRQACLGSCNYTSVFTVKVHTGVCMHGLCIAACRVTQLWPASWQLLALGESMAAACGGVMHVGSQLAGVMLLGVAYQSELLAHVFPSQPLLFPPWSQTD